MRYRALAIGVLLLTCAAAQAREFRRLNAVPTPKRLMKKGAKPVEKIQPLDTRELEASVRSALSSWNTATFADLLDETFYDKERLVDSMSEKVRRDAKVRVLGVRNVQILQQSRGPQAPGSSADMLTSLVSATVRTQIEYTDPQRGFQRIEGVNEVILRIEAERAK